LLQSNIDFSQPECALVACIDSFTQSKDFPCCLWQSRYRWKYLESRQVRHTQSAKDLVNHRTGNTITLKDFDIVKKVGTGAHGLVVAGYRKNSEDKVDRKMYAIKQMKKS